MINLKEQKKNAQAFIKRWEDRGNERQDSQSFWLDLLQSVYGIEKPSKYITFEDKVMLDHTSFIDGFIDTTKVLIEQKGADKDLNKAIKQSDGTFLTPFQQAKRKAPCPPRLRVLFLSSLILQIGILLRVIIFFCIAHDFREQFFILIFQIFFV